MALVSRYFKAVAKCHQMARGRIFLGQLREQQSGKSFAFGLVLCCFDDLSSIFGIFSLPLTHTQPHSIFILICYLSCLAKNCSRSRAKEWSQIVCSICWYRNSASPTFQTVVVSCALYSEFCNA